MMEHEERSGLGRIWWLCKDYLTPLDDTATTATPDNAVRSVVAMKLYLDKIEMALHEIWELNRSFIIHNDGSEDLEEVPFSPEEAVRAMVNLQMAADAEAHGADEARKALREALHRNEMYELAMNEESRRALARITEAAVSLRSMMDEFKDTIEPHYPK